MDKTPHGTAELANELEQKLMQRYDMPLLAGEDLRRALGYKSLDALRQAIQRDTVPVPVFAIENRRGKYALVRDIALWLATQRTDVEGL